MPVIAGQSVVVNLINNRPRKCLDYRTPNEVFYEGRSDSDAIQT
jgi:IS30 family transposase